MGQVAEIWRHPIKSHGREPVGAVTLTAGQTMPGDRVWAVAHALSKATDEAWTHCAAFSIGAKSPLLQGIQATTLADGRLTLTHPDLPANLTLDPDRDGDALIVWAAPLMNPDRTASARIVRVPGRGMTDTAYPSVSLLNLASHHEVEERHGARLSPLRWRGNFLLDGLAAWDEFSWLGRKVRIGGAVLAVRDRIKRCNATRANPQTGQIEADTLAILKDGWGHQDFGVYAEIVESGPVKPGDAVEILP